MVIKIIFILTIYTFCLFGNKITDGIYWVGSASSSAVGMALTAKSNESDAIFFNPAALNSHKKSSFNASYTSIYDTNFTTVSYIASNEIISFGLGAHTNQSANIAKTSFNEDTNQITANGQYNYMYSAAFISSAIKMPLISFGHIGGSLHFHRMIIENEAINGRSINLGVFLTPFSNLNIGLIHHNVIPLYLTWLTKDQINTEISTTIHKINTYRTIGFEWIGYKETDILWKLLVDYDLDTIKKDATNNYHPVKIGSEIEYQSYKIKAGHNFRFSSFGVSVKLNQLQLNYSFMFPNDQEMLDNRHAFGLNYFL